MIKITHFDLKYATNIINTEDSLKPSIYMMHAEIDGHRKVFQDKKPAAEDDAPAPTHSSLRSVCNPQAKPTRVL
jgi:hypothetical protein